MQNRKTASACLISLAAALLLCAGCGSQAATADKAAASELSGNSLSDVFEVIDFLPGDELPSEVKHPSIQIQFSEPVVALKKLGMPSDKSDIVSIEPALKGVFRWYGTSLLSFESSEEVIPQRVYTVRVKPGTVSASGKTISGKLDYTFHTEELRLKSVIPGYGAIQDGIYVDSDDVPIRYATDLALVLNAPVDTDELRKYLTVKGGEHAYPFKLDAKKTEAEDSDNVIVRLELQERPEENQTVTVTLASGARADAQAYPTSRQQEASYHTIAPFALRQFSSGSDTYYSDEYSNPVAYRFTAPLKDGQEAAIVKGVSTNLGTTVRADNVAVTGSTVLIYGLPVAYESTYTIGLNCTLTDIYDRTLTLSGDLHSVTVPKAASFASFKNWGLKMLEAQFDPRIAFQFQNLHEGSAYSLAALTTADGVPLPVAPAQEDIGSGYPENTKIIKAVDLTPALQRTSGGEWHGAVRFTADAVYEYRYRDWRTDELQSRLEHQQNEQVIQVTDLGMTVRYGYNKAVVMVTSLKTGEPVTGATVSAYKVGGDYETWELVHKAFPRVTSATTDASGCAVLTFRNFASDFSSASLYIEAKTKDDRAIFAPGNHNMWRSGVYNYESPRSAENTHPVAFLFTDRGLYKPGERLTFRGIDRNLRIGEYSPYEGKFTITLQDASWRPTTYATLSSHTTANGTFWGTFDVPADLEPGTYELAYSREGTTVRRCPVQVQFFERLRFEASASVAPLTYYSGDTLSADLAAQYLGGGNLNDCQYDASWSREPTGFRPAGSQFDGMSFGPVQGYDGRSYLGSTEGMLSGEGKASLSQKTGGEKLKGQAYRYRMEARVTDSGNQTITASAETTVHPAQFYLGVGAFKNVKGFAKKGQAIKLDYTCVTPAGEAPAASLLPGSPKLRVELLREDWKQLQQVGWNGQLTTRYEKIMVSESDQTLTLSAKAPAEITVTPPSGGTYILRLSTKDAQGNEVITEKRFYATSSDWYWNSRDSNEEITLTADKDQYAVGDTAQVLMQSPLPRGRYLITIEREGILSEEVRVIDEPTSVLSFDIKDSYVPVMYVAISSYSLRTEPPAKDYNTRDIGKPKGYFGVVPLYVSTDTRSFGISIQADKALYKPGQQATITLKATTKGGAPVANAEITLMAVDRGVIDLINYHVPDPVSYFYDPERFPVCTQGGDSRYLLMDPITYTTNTLVGGDADSKLEERKNFDPTAVFVPALITGADGTASYTFTLPDSLTAYRVTAVGVNRNDFALAEDQISVANPVSVRAVQPRQLRQGDQSEIGVTVTNLEDVSHAVTVRMAVYDGLERIPGDLAEDDEVQKLPGSAALSGDTTRTLTVGGQKTAPLMFTVQAKQPGWVTVEYTIQSDVLNERILMPLQIEKPYIYETVATVGEVRSDGNAAASLQEMLVLPGDAEDNQGSLYVQLDPTRLGVLREAIGYVFHYPYGCLEQRTSAVLPLAAFGDYLKLFGLEGEVKSPAKVVQKELATIAAYQCIDGGFPYWPDGRYSSTMVSARIAEITGIAKQKGIKVPAKLDTVALIHYLTGHANELLSRYGDSTWAYYEAAHLYYAASCIGATVDTASLERIAKKDDVGVNALALCALTYDNIGKKSQAESLLRQIKRYFKQTTRGVDIADADYGSYWSFCQDQSEKYALCLQAFSRLATTDSVNQHLVYELLQLQKQNKGHWHSTAATSRVLIALDEYIGRNDLKSLDFTAKVLLNGQKIAQGSFKGAAAEPAEATLLFSEAPLKSMPRDKELLLEFTKDGTGTLYYTAALKYALPVEQQTARDEGICIFTEITDVKTGQVVSGDKLVAGNVYRERVFISTTRNRQYVAVRAPIPSGAEVLNAAFVTTGTLPRVAGEDEDDARQGYNHGLSYQGIYDAEVQYFWDYFPRGNQTVEFMFRAVRKGQFNTPSSTAECMYQEEIFGRGNGAVWTIE